MSHTKVTNLVNLNPLSMSFRTQRTADTSHSLMPRRNKGFQRRSQSQQAKLAKVTNSELVIGTKVYITLAMNYQLFNNVIKPKVHAVYCYVSNVEESDLEKSHTILMIDFLATLYNLLLFVFVVRVSFQVEHVCHVCPILPLAIVQWTLTSKTEKRRFVWLICIFIDPQILNKPIQ